jgi:hypothetical protein
LLEFTENVMEVCEDKDVYEQRTRLSGLAYCFTPKHHGGGSRTDSRWLPDLPRAEEFSVFDMADAHGLNDDKGNLYGLRIRESTQGRELLELGVWHETIARFWFEAPPAHWHGHPLWRVGDGGPENRRGQRYCPPKTVFDRMVQANIVNVVQASRLKAGKHIRKL